MVPSVDGESSNGKTADFGPWLWHPTVV